MMKLLALALMLTLAHSLSAAIAIDAGPSSNAVNAATNTKAFTTGSGTDTILIVGTISSNGGAFNQVTSVKWGSDTLTYKRRDQRKNGGVGINMEIWYLLAPAASTNQTITVTYGASNANILSVYSLSGVDQITPWGADYGDTGIVSPHTTTITTTTDDSWLLFHYGMYLKTTATLDADFTSDIETTDPFFVYHALAHFQTGAAGAQSATNSYTGVYGQTVQQLLELVETNATATPSRTVTPTLTITPTLTDSPTLTYTPTYTGTYTETPTLTITLTPTPTATRTITLTVTPTPSITRTATSTPIVWRFRHRTELDGVEMASCNEYFSNISALENPCKI